MASVNKAIILGYVGQEPKIATTKTGQKVANLSVATTERAYKTKDGRDVPEHTEWHNVTVWRGLAELAEKFIHKGTQVYITGSLHTRSYDASNGEKRTIVEIEGDEILLLGKHGSVFDELMKSSSPVDSLKTGLGLVAEESNDNKLPF